MRRSDPSPGRGGRALLLLLAAEGVLLLALLLHSRLASSGQARAREPLRGLAARLTLAEPALWPEARYTRHPATTDRFAPFQEFPGALEHFPAGSLVPPPRERP